MSTAYPRSEPRPDRMKRCAACQEWFPVTCFHRDPGNPDFRRNECIACRQERRRILRRGARRLRPWGRRNATANA